jgi:4-hydroxy-tetrahydrodipicolinate synthase
MPLFAGLFVEVNPVPVKEALYYMGYMEKDVRLPLCGLSKENSEHVKGLIRDFGLLTRDV